MIGQENKCRQQFISFQVQRGYGRFQVEAIAVLGGNDISVIIGGGTHYHIGATALASPRPSLAEPEKISASASVICVMSHKDDEIARKAALSLASYLNCVAVVSVGLHVDNAAEQDISALLSNFDIVLEQIKNRSKEILESNNTLSLTVGS
jgi:hypothetical protein